MDNKIEDDMQLSIPTNWDDELIDRVSDFPVVEMYGSLQKTPIGGGRPPVILPDVSVAAAEQHIRKAIDNGIDFNYLLNSPCTGNREYDPNFKDTIIEHVKWAADKGCKGVTVANSFMLDLVKTHVPGLSATISVYGFVDTVDKARSYESIGADVLTISLSSNRNFDLLKQIPKASDCRLKILVNQCCLFECPYAVFHCLTSGHESQDWNENRGLANAYCMIKCSLEKLEKNEALIKSRWVRPEDMEAYEGLGYHFFKIAGRDMSTDWIHRVTRAYTQRRYDGNLMDILNAAYLTFPAGVSQYFKEIKVPRVDNTQLDGFLEFFKDTDCRNKCHECDYCKVVAEKTVTSFDEENREIRAVLRELIEASFVV